MGFYGNCCGGSYEDGFEFVRDSGIPDEACMAYVDGTGCSCASSCDVSCTYRSTGSCSDATCSDRCSDWQSRLVSIDASAPVPSGQMKEYLVSEGPLSVAMGVGSGYGGAFDAQGVYRCSNDDGANHGSRRWLHDVGVTGLSRIVGALAGTAMAIVGYGEAPSRPGPLRRCTRHTAATPTPTACPSDDDCDGILTPLTTALRYNPGQTNTMPFIDMGRWHGDDVTVPNGDISATPRSRRRQ
jgi:hypothetical protein